LTFIIVIIEVKKMTVSSEQNGRTVIFIPKANEPIENGYWIYSDTLEKVNK